MYCSARAQLSAKSFEYYALQESTGTAFSDQYASETDKVSPERMATQLTDPQPGAPHPTSRLANSLALALKIRASIRHCTRIVEYALPELEIAVCDALWRSFWDADVLRSQAGSRQEWKCASAPSTHL